MSEKSQLVFLHLTGEVYLQMYDLVLECIYGDLKRLNVHVLVITTSSFKSKVEELHAKYGLHEYAFVMITTYESYLGSYSGKLDIVDWPHLDEYHKVIYTDADILFFPNTLETLFAIIRYKDVMFVCPEGMEFTQPWFYHKDIYTEEETIAIQQGPNKVGINTGLWGWIHSPGCMAVKQLQAIRENVNEKSKTIVTDAAEQPYINHRWLVDGNISYEFGQIVHLSPERVLPSLTDYIKELKRLVPAALHFTHDRKLQRMEAIMPMIRELQKHVK